MKRVEDQERQALMTFAEAAAWVGPRREGRPTNVTTIRTWALHGLRGLRLQHQYRGNTPFTTVEWLEAFFEAIREAKDAERDAPPMLQIPSYAERQRRIEKAKEKLRACGVL